MHWRTARSVVLLVLTALSSAGCMVAYPFTWALAPRATVSGQPAEPPHPTSWTFDAEPEEVETALLALVCWPSEIWDDSLDGSEPKRTIHVVEEREIPTYTIPLRGFSAVYHGSDGMLPITGELAVQLVPIGSGQTDVHVRVSPMDVRIGEWWTGHPHGGFETIDEAVGPTTIEAYALLRLLGTRLGATDMPPLRWSEDQATKLIETLLRTRRDFGPSAGVLAAGRPTWAYGLLERSYAGGNERRLAAFEIQSRIVDPAATSVLTRALRRGYGGVRYAAAEALEPLAAR